MTSKTNIDKYTYYFLFFLLVFHIILLVNTKFTLWPEMVVYPYLVNNGFLLYKDIFNPYPPLLTIILSQITKVLGYGVLNFQIFTWLVILFIDGIIFTLARRITKNSSHALLSVIFFTFFSIPFGVNGLWFDLVQTPFILISVYLFYSFILKKKFYYFYLSAFFLLVGVSLKQQAAWLFIGFLLFIIFSKKISAREFLKRLHILIFLLFFAAVLHLMFSHYLGVVEDFLFWVVKFPIFEASSMPGYVLFPMARQIVVLTALFLIFTPIFLTRVFVYRFILLISLYLLVFAYPRFDYFHLIPSLAVIALLAGPLIERFFKSPLIVKTVSLFALVFLASFSARFYLNSLASEVRFFEKEIFDSAVFISNYVPQEEKIYIQNGPDQLLVLSQRLPPKPWADEFSWYLEIGGMQDEIIQGIRMEQTKFIVFKPYKEGEKYDLGVYRPKKIADFINRDYKNVMQISQNLWLKLKYEN